MDRTLSKHKFNRTQVTASNVASRSRIAVGLSHFFAKQTRAFAGVCAITAVTLGLFSGCQSSPWSQSELPVPPAAIDLGQLESAAPAASLAEAYRDSGQSPNQERSSSVRYQSPDDDRVRSLNDFSYDALAKSSSQQLESQQPPKSDRVAEVIIKGNQLLNTYELQRKMRTRPGRFFDPDKLQQDVNELWRMPAISRIKGPFLEKTPNGVIITVEIVETSSISEIKFIGNRGISDAKLERETGLQDGEPLDVHEIRSAKTKIEELYHGKGYPRTQVEILEGSDGSDNRVVFLIHEDEKQRIWKVDFEGNTIATDGRLRSFIKSKPGIMKVIGGLVKRDEIEQDITRLTSYYRSLGFFNARVGREISESNDGRWLNLRFIINEGPRYRVRRVAFMGNAAYSPEQLASMVELKPNENDSPEFNVAKMNADVVSLRDLYGSEGFIFANIVAEPRFLEEPGLLDIVYKIEEGKQYYAGEIRIHYVGGGGGITRREVPLNRLSVRTGDLINVREIRNSERRLGAANIFANGQQGGASPRIVLSPAETKELERMASRAGYSAGTGGGSRH
jgi:outer membrane protein insertion porin family